MRHCVNFTPKETYYLKETSLYIYRMLTIGFCPVCEKPAAELYQVRFDGKPERYSWTGIDADEHVDKLSGEILYSVKSLNYKRAKSKPYGWRYGVNQSSKNNKTGKITVKQYACDFYGSKELVKSF